MSTLYEHEYQIRSVIAKSHRQADQTVRLSPGASRHAAVVVSKAGFLLKIFRKRMHGIKAPARHVPAPVVKSGLPVTILHAPEY